MYSLKWDRTYSGTKWITRAFMMSETAAAHIVKWGGSYDIAYTDGTLIPTGIRCVSNLTIRQWVELANKLKRWNERKTN
jgi:hypothetical protein